VCSIAVTNMVLLPMTLRVSTKSIDKYFLQNVGHHGTVDIARMLLELIFIRDGSLYVNLPCFAHDVLFLISYLSTM